MKGGYSMIDCGGLDLIKGSTPQTIAGLRAQCESALKVDKMVIACNCVWDEKPVTSIPVMLVKIGDDIIGSFGTLQIWVDKDSVVTIVNLVA